MLGILIGTTSSVIGSKVSAIAAGIKNYKSLIKKKKRKHNKIVLLAKSKLNSIKVLISKALIASNIIHEEFFLINNVLKEYDDIKEEMKNLLKILNLDFSLFIKQYYHILWGVEKIQNIKT